MSNFIVLFDACVFYPAPLGDLLMQLTITDLFRAKWSPLIHEEWMASVAPDRPELSREKLEGTKERMAHVRDFLVTGIEFLIPVLSLPDPDDRHVLAAAIHARASVIVTSNLKTFRQRCYVILMLMQHPDEFISCLMDLSPAKVVAAVRTVRQRLRNPPISPQRYLVNLAKQAIVETVSLLRASEEVI